MTISQNTSIDSDPVTNSLKALGHPTRVEIVRQLAQRDRCCTGDFCDCLNLAQSTISQHLDLLVGAGLVERKQSGTKSIFSLNRSELSSLGDAISSIAETSCCTKTTC